MNKKIIYSVLFIGLVILIGFLRETYFVRIKWNEAVIEGTAYKQAAFWLFTFLENLSLNQLTIAKYIGTIFFVLAFWGLSLLMIKLFFTNQNYYRLIHFVFILVLSFGLLVYAIGFLFAKNQEFYSFSRWIIGFIETPLSIAILFPVLWITRNKTQ